MDRSKMMRGVFALGIGATLWTAPAFAAEPPAAPAKPDAADAPPSREATEAQRHFERAVQLFDEGDFKLALVEFQRSYELVPNWRVLYNIGEVHYQLNNYALALRTLEKYLEEGGPRVQPKRKSEVDRDIESLRIRTAHLSITTNVEGADLYVDGERIGRAPLGTSELVDAGSHKVSAVKAGFSGNVEAVTLVGGDTKSVNVKLTAVERERTIVELKDSSGLGAVWIGWGLTAALAAGTVGTGVAWGSASSQLDELKSRQTSRAELDSQAGQVDTLRVVTFALAGATVVAGGVSLYFTLTHETKATANTKTRSALPTTRLVLGPTGGTLLATF